MIEALILFNLLFLHSVLLHQMLPNRTTRNLPLYFFGCRQKWTNYHLQRLKLLRYSELIYFNDSLGSLWRCQKAFNLLRFNGRTIGIVELEDAEFEFWIYRLNKILNIFHSQVQRLNKLFMLFVSKQFFSSNSNDDGGCSC